MEKIYILDGSGYLYRAYHALPELSDKEGNNVNCLFGFLRMLIKLLQDKPAYFLIAWDSPVKTIRHELYADYKANRPAIPDNFKWQINQVKQLINRLGVPYQEIPGYEADDIIYTITQKFQKEYFINIITGDKDLKQLIADNVVILDPLRQITVTQEMFRTEMGFAPANFLDYLIILGDSSDNVPGVKGIGKKGAQELIIKYGTIENILQNIDTLSPSIKEKITANISLFKKSEQLIKLYEVPSIENISISHIKLNLDFKLWDQILVKEMQFHSISKNISQLQNKFEKGAQTGFF